jgi:HlyD family secretion protein
MTRRRIITIVALVVVVVAAIVAWRWSAGSKTPVLKFETTKVDQGRITAKVTATGTLSAIVTVQVGSQVSGTIKELHADFNSQVKKGQVIAKIDPQLFQAAVEQARANFTAAQGNLAKAKAQAVDAQRQYERNKTLAEEKLIATADLDTSQSNAEAAQAQVQAAGGSVAQTRAALHQTEVNLAYTSIVSPTDGVVISRNVDVGQTVAASLQAPTIFVIAEDLAKMQVDTSVAEADVGRLAAGMPSTFNVDAYPSQAFKGTIRQIRNAPQTVQNVVTYDAVVDVANPDLKLKPGMTANVTFIYADKDDVLRVPNAALRFNPPAGLVADASNPARGQGQGRGAQGGAPGAGAPGAGARPQGQGRPPQARSQTPDRRAVWVLRDGKPVQVRVRIGISDGTLTEIAEGEIKAGDLVITDASGGSEGDAGGGAGRRAPFRLF